jgi:hypothetical protein
LRWENGVWSHDALQPAHGELEGIACAAHSCQAVGTAEVPLHRRGQGTAWVAVPAAKPSGPAFTESYAVSCGSAPKCLAVGSSDAAGGHLPFAMLWNGTRWATVNTSGIAPAGREAVLDAVSCLAATNCFAVGYSLDASRQEQALAAQWNGSQWSSVSLSTSVSSLRGVACSTATDCTAVGSTELRGLIERWNGNAWHEEGVSVASRVSIFNAVACRSTSFCTAVGEADNYDDPGIAHRSGSTWSVQPSASAPSGGLWSVACPAATSCLAGGALDTDDGFEGAIAEHWDGAHWVLTQPQFTPPEHGGPLALTGTSCASTTQCWAVGGFATATAQFWNGTHWWQASLPASVYALNAVSCDASRPCVAVGRQAVVYP